MPMYIPCSSQLLALISRLREAYDLIKNQTCHNWHAAAAKSIQSCPTLCNSIDGSPPGSPSLGLSRQEYWSGLPFPSPMHESAKTTYLFTMVNNYFFTSCVNVFNVCLLL